MASVVAIIDASWSGATLTFVAVQSGSQLATGSATIAQLAGNTYKATGTVDLSSATPGSVSIALNDASGNLAWHGEYYVNGAGAISTIIAQIPAIVGDHGIGGR